MRLRRGDPVLVSHARQRSGRKPGHLIRPNREGVITDAECNIASGAPPVAEIERDGARGLAWHDPCRAAHTAAVDRHFHDVAVRQPVFVGSRRTYGDDIVPRDLGQRLRQLLQPRNIGEAAVPNAWIGVEDDLQMIAVSVALLWWRRDFGGQ